MLLRILIYTFVKTNKMALKEDYKRVTYKDLQKKLHAVKDNSDLSDIALTMKLGIKSTQTVRNAFRMDTQIASDQLLTNVMKAVGLKGKVEWIEGIRYYSIKN